MSIEFNTFGDLLHAVRGLPAMPIAVIDADERHVLEGVCEATEAGYIDPVLIGDEISIQNKLATIAGAKRFRILHAPAEDVMAEKGVELIEKGEVKALMKGHIHTDSFLHPILLHHLQGKKRISHVFLADLKTYPKLLYITDAAINISPDLLTKMHIVQNAVDFARLLGVEKPKVAALSAVEVINPAIASTVDAACIAKMAERGQIKGAVVDGPLAFDNAISASCTCPRSWVVAKKFSRRSSIHLTGRFSFMVTQGNRTSSGWNIIILGPKPPPMNGAITRT